MPTAVKGYYATVCQGMTILSNVVNGAGGVALTVFGVITALDKTTQPFGYMYLGYFMVAVGLLLLINAIINILGAVRESKQTLKGGLISTVIAVLLLIAMIGLAYLMMTKVQKGGRAAYLKLKMKDKASLERKYECCGWDDPTQDATPNCQSKHPCEEPVGNMLLKSARLRMIIPAVGVIIQAFVLFAVGCLFRKISKQKPKVDKSLSLIEQARMKEEGRKIEPARKSKIRVKQEKKTVKAAGKEAKKNKK